MYENGVRQQISHFASSEEPFAVMLLLDLSGSTQDEVDLIKRGAGSFLAELRADDRVGVIVFDSKVRVLAEASGNPRRGIGNRRHRSSSAAASDAPQQGTSFICDASRGGQTTLKRRGS